MGRSKTKRKVEVTEENLNRFAGSSDEEDENEGEVEKEEEESANSSKKDEQPKSDEDDDDEIIEPEQELEPASAKMANAMTRILGTSSKSKAASVVLSKTTTPLQRMQIKEKEQAKVLKEKRHANRERNLTALHIPLSVATTNTIETTGRHSVALELEQERFHRRVATRGVVALFNAITQHQKATESDDSKKKQKDTSKMTKHSFLDKIKSAASSASGDQSKATMEKDEKDQDKNETRKWDALKDDYLMDSKKNWDQESSDEEEETSDGDEAPKKKEGAEKARKKRRRVGSKR